MERTNEYHHLISQLLVINELPYRVFQVARLRVSDSRESQNFYIEQKGVVCLVVSLTKKAQELECHIVKTLTDRERDDSRKQQRQLERIKNACGENTTKTKDKTKNVEKNTKNKKFLKEIKKGNNNHLKEKKER